MKRISDLGLTTNLKYRDKLVILSKIMTFSKILIDLSNKIVTVKKEILKKLKKHSFQDLNHLFHLTKDKSSNVLANFKRLTNLKNSLRMVHKIFSNSDNLQNVKEKIIDNVDYIDNKLANTKKYKDYHKDLSDTVHDLHKKGHKEASLLIEKKEIRKLTKNEDDLITEINELTNKQINENKKINNTLTNNTTNINNNGNHKEKLNSMHDKLIAEYTDLKDFVTKLEKVKKVFTNKEDIEKINEKIQKNQNIIRFIKKLIKYTRLSLNNLKINLNSKKI